MFIGHYGPALAAKPLAPGVSQFRTFLAVQFLDVLWAIFILVGVERARVFPGFLPASPLDLYYMPWTHSLLMAVAWSWLVFRVMRSWVLGGLVFSHWILDLVVHTHDLPLWMRGGPKLGLGLWHFREASLLVEAGLLWAGLAVYMRSTVAKTPAGRWAMPAFCLALVGIELYNLYGPAPGNIREVALSAELAYFVFAVVAGRLDRLRDAPTRADVSQA